MNGSSSTKIWNHAFLSSATILSQTSAPMAVGGNTVTVAVQVLNIVLSGNDFRIDIQGSYDGRTWETALAGTALTALGYASYTQGSFDYALVRLYAELGAGTNKVLFNAAIAFSNQ